MRFCGVEGRAGVTGPVGLVTHFGGFQGFGGLIGWYYIGLCSSQKIVMQLVLWSFFGFCKGKEFLGVVGNIVGNSWYKWLYN